MTSRNQHARVEIAAEGIDAALDPKGAQLVSLRAADGTELLWQGDPGVWPDQAPLLFPVIGPVTDGVIHHDGKSYPMPAHGFAQQQEFTVRQHLPTRAVLGLAADAETRTHYPFDFDLEAAFQVERRTLTVTLTVTNTEDVPMPADVGFHPGFRRPLRPDQGSEMQVRFAQEEPAPIRRGVDDPIFLTETEHPTPVQGNVLHLLDELFDDNALVFDRIASRSLTYEAEGGAAGVSLRIEYPDSPFLAIWRRPGAGFTAIEPWQGLPSPVGYAGPLGEKPGVAVLAPGESRNWRLIVTILDPLEESA